MSNINKLKKHLENGQNWEKMESAIQGVHIVKVPATKTRKSILYLEINPLKENGKPVKRKGVFINSTEILHGFKEALNNEKALLLIKIIEQVNKEGSTDLDEQKERSNIHGENNKDNTEEEIEDQEIIETFITEKEPQQGERLYIDIANILYLDHDENNNLKAENIPKLIEKLKHLDYNPILIADASIKYEMDDRKKYERMISDKVILEAPAGRAADVFILKLASKKDCKFLTNDLYRDYYDNFDKDWIFSHRLTCMFEDGEIIID